jgi:glutathionylspermidine synthase
VKRQHHRPRPGWERIVAEQGMCFGTPARDASGADRNYWDESVHYVFDMDEVLALEAQVEVLHSMCLDAVEHVVLAAKYAIAEFVSDKPGRKVGSDPRQLSFSIFNLEFVVTPSDGPP